MCLPPETSSTISYNYTINTLHLYISINHLCSPELSLVQLLPRFQCIFAHLTTYVTTTYFILSYGIKIIRILWKLSVIDGPHTWIYLYYMPNSLKIRIGEFGQSSQILMQALLSLVTLSHILQVYSMHLTIYFLKYEAKDNV